MHTIAHAFRTHYITSVNALATVFGLTSAALRTQNPHLPDDGIIAAETVVWLPNAHSFASSFLIHDGRGTQGTCCSADVDALLRDAICALLAQRSGEPTRIPLWQDKPGTAAVTTDGTRVLPTDTSLAELLADPRIDVAKTFEQTPKPGMLLYLLRKVPSGERHDFLVLKSAPRPEASQVTGLTVHAKTGTTSNPKVQPAQVIVPAGTRVCTSADTSADTSVPLVPPAEEPRVEVVRACANGNRCRLRAAVPRDAPYEVHLTTEGPVPYEAGRPGAPRGRGRLRPASSSSSARAHMVLEAAAGVLDRDVLGRDGRFPSLVMPSERTGAPVSPSSPVSLSWPGSPQSGLESLWSPPPDSPPPDSPPRTERDDEEDLNKLLLSLGR